jgi:Ni,Fe-hydrogenase I cytochrome b subunit
MLLQINVFLDVFFSLLWGVTALGLVFHFVLSILTGRARKSFIEGKWPEHEERAPALPKVMHAQHMFMMILLAVTGMYIRFPWFNGGRTVMRDLHYFAMIVVTVNLIWRVWYAFGSKNADWREFAIDRKDAASLVGVAKFYAYLSNNKPHVAKYNVMQKGTYLLFLTLMCVQAFTGFALLTQRFMGVSPQDVLIGWWLGALVGSTALAGWIMRTVHYTINWLFIVITTVHVYLSATIDVPVTMDFFGIKPLTVVPAHGHSVEPEEAAPSAAASFAPTTE